jgi:hypothetical protein
MPASELLIAFIAFVGVPGVLIIAGAIIGKAMQPPPEEPLYRPQDWGCQDIDRRKS